jgi:hypothetical protein
VQEVQWEPALHRLFSGTSDRVINDLARAAERRPDYMQPALRRDVEGARGFFECAPKWMRAVRLRHGLAAGPITRDDFERLVHEEVVAAIGPFTRGRLPDPSGGIVGKRMGRALAIRAANGRRMKF